MYSSRRRYYRRYSRRNLFSPSYRTGSSPTYTQMKGRVIRTTPMYDNPNQFPPVVSKEILDKMYKKLIDAKYPIPMPPIPPIPDFSSFTTMVLLNYEYRDLSVGENTFNSDILSQLIADQITLPEPPSQTHWVYSMIAIGLTRYNNSGTDTSRFQVSWTSPLLLAQYSPAVLIDKSVDFTYANSRGFERQIFVVADSSNEAYFNRLTFLTTSIETSKITVGTTDSNIQNNVTYPLVTTDTSLETYSSSILFNKVNSDYESVYSYQFYVLCYIKPN